MPDSGNTSEEVWLKRLKREREARMAAEKLLEEKSLELYFRNLNLKELSDNQEELIRHRTEELRKALEAANHANNTKREFFANVSHELRTPLNGILGMAHMLLDTDLNHLQKDYAQTILVSSEILLNLINDILDFSKIEAGKLDLEITNFNISTLLFEVLDILWAKAVEKNLHLLLKYDPSLPLQFTGDPNRIKQILLNLGSNAIKFTESGIVTIEVSMKNQEGKMPLLFFQVKDTGIGIPKEKQDFLFTPFTQAEASTTRRFGGTGLGLSISKNLVELMGGEIGLISDSGKGSEFWFKLPLAHSLETDGLLESVPVLMAGYEAWIYIPFSELQEEIIRHFNAWGITTNSIENLEQLQNKNPKENTILICGPDEEESILELARNGSIDTSKFKHCLFLSGQKNARTLELAKLSGFDSVVFKPIKYRQVQLELNAALNSDSQAINKKQKAENTQKTKIEFLRILIVEDNPINLKVAKALFKKFGYNVSSAENGLRALELLKQEQFDLIFMDFQMPELDGYETTLRIRGKDIGMNKKDIPIIAMTANAMRGDQEKCIQAGMNDFLAKPIIPAELDNLLKNWKKKLNK